jgi:PadR family transcriptional regulator PadR
MSIDRRPQWLRGILDLCVLAALADADRYGYELARQLEEAGLGVIKGGTLYPVLARLEAQELVTTAWREGQGGPARKYYALTSGGRRFLRTHTEQWLAFAPTVERLLQRAGDES